VLIFLGGLGDLLEQREDVTGAVLLEDLAIKRAGKFTAVAVAEHDALAAHATFAAQARPYHRARFRVWPEVDFDRALAKNLGSAVTELGLERTIDVHHASVAGVEHSDQARREPERSCEVNFPFHTCF